MLRPRAQWAGWKLADVVSLCVCGVFQAVLRLGGAQVLSISSTLIVYLPLEVSGRSEP